MPSAYWAFDVHAQQPHSYLTMTCPHQANYEQSIRNRGQWLLEHETALKAVQSYLISKFWEAYEADDNSEDLDSYLCQIQDHMMLLCKVIANLRQAEFWPKTVPAPEAEPKSAE